MSAAGPPPGDPFPAGTPDEERVLREQRAAYEAELARITVPDMLMQATVSLLNLAAHRLAPAPAGAEGEGQGRDLEQVRDAIDGVRGLLDILERRMPGELKPLRDALSQLQMAYAAEVSRPAAEQTAGPAGAGDAPGGDAPGGGATGDAPDDGPGDEGSNDGEDGNEGPEGGDGPGGDTGRGGGSGPGPGGDGGGGAPARPPGSEPRERGPGPAESSGRLWVPGR